MAIFCWGSTAHGELGLGGIEDEQVVVIKDVPGGYIHMFIFMFIFLYRY